MAREEGKRSERRGCELIGMNRGSWRYQRKERNEAALRARLRELAGERPRFGYRRLHCLLRREKEHGIAQWVVNHKRVYRLYREEGLAMRLKGKRLPVLQRESRARHFQPICDSKCLINAVTVYVDFKFPITRLTRQ